MTSSSFNLSTSHSLIHRAQNFEPAAWTVVLRLYGPLVYGWGRKSGLQNADAADLVQEVFVSVWRGLTDFSLDRPDATFRGWLLTITRNALRQRARRDRPVSVPSDLLDALADAATEMPSSSEFIEHAYEGLLQRALEIVRESVDESTWQSFWQVSIENRPVDLVAQELQMTQMAVRQSKYRVLCRLKSLLADR